MYIAGINVTDKSLSKKKVGKPGASGFSELVSSSESEESQIFGTSSVSGAGSLFFLQEVNDEEAQKKEVVSQGFDAIKYLDNIRIGLLCGTLSKDTIIGLESLLEKFRKNFSDPKLSQIIDEIELRAKVEIAKLNR